MKVERIEIVTSTDIGEISEIKYKKLSPLLEDEHTLELSQEKQAIIIKAKSEEYDILIFPKGIRYRNFGDTIERNNIDELLRKIYDAFMIDDNCYYLLDFIGTSKYEFDCFEDSKKYYNNLENFKNIKGIGYRFLSETEEYNQDYKKEPVINENNRYYYRLTRIFNKNKIQLSILLDNLFKIYATKDNEFME